jgi:hypothetical protein
MDETLAAEIPFYTGREAIAVDGRSLRGSRQGTPPAATLPPWLLVQDNHEANILAPGPEYLLVAQRSFGPGRSLMLWQVRDSAARP